VYLDGCFGTINIVFLVKNIALDGFKIDKSLVDAFQLNIYHKSFIRAFGLFFCGFNKMVCIGEGGDKLDKFEVLRALDVNGFQGYLTGRPRRKFLPIALRK
jgi:FOG: EAL domain